MGMFSAVLPVAGAFLVVLVVVAMLVAGWEWLRQREHLDSLRRDRACQAATSPLPLPAVPQAREHAGTNRAGPWAATPAAAMPLTLTQAGRRDANWIETRPMVLSPRRAADEVAPAPAPLPAPAPATVGEPDLLLE